MCLLLIPLLSPLIIYVNGKMLRKIQFLFSTQLVHTIDALKAIIFFADNKHIIT